VLVLASSNEIRISLVIGSGADAAVIGNWLSAYCGSLTSLKIGVA
jgi:hypothetical protein